MSKVVSAVSFGPKVTPKVEAKHTIFTIKCVDGQFEKKEVRTDVDGARGAIREIQVTDIHGKVLETEDFVSYAISESHKGHGLHVDMGDVFSLDDGLTIISEPTNMTDGHTTVVVDADTKINTIRLVDENNKAFFIIYVKRMVEFAKGDVFTLNNGDQYVVLDDFTLTDGEGLFLKSPEGAVKDLLTAGKVMPLSKRQFTIPKYSFLLSK